MKAQILLLIPLLIPLGWCEPLKGKQPLVYPNWPPTKSKLPMRTLMLQIRTGNRLPGSYLMKGYPQSQRFHRPLKMSIPNFNYLKSPMFKRPLSFAPQQNKHKFVKFHGSQPGPNTGEYIYETPMLVHGSPQIDNALHLNDVIHTIPAPNLALGTSNFIPDLSLHHDNHIQFESGTLAPFFPSRPAILHQYQVTEEPSNDHTLTDPFSGQHKLYAPDPDPSLPAHKLRLATDPLSQPTINNHPFDVYNQYKTSGQHEAPGNQHQYFQIINAVPQQQLPDHYGLPISSQPQLQQHIHQQASIYGQGQSMPMSSVYNPTYLVQQSNTLLNQHQQHQNLFKPEASFVASFNEQPQHAHTQQYSPEVQVTYHGNHPTFTFADNNYEQNSASIGQLYEAAKDPANDEYQFQASNNAPAYAQLVGVHSAGAGKDQSKPSETNGEIITTTYYAASASDKDIPEVIKQNYYNQPEQYQQHHHEHEHEHEHHHYPPQEQPTNSGHYYELHQQQNEQIIAQAQQDLYQKQHAAQNTEQEHRNLQQIQYEQDVQKQNFAAQQQMIEQETHQYHLNQKYGDEFTAHQQHQNLLAQQLTKSTETTEPMRIFVPDDDYVHDYKQTGIRNRLSEDGSSENTEDKSEEVSSETVSDTVSSESQSKEDDSKSEEAS